MNRAAIDKNAIARNFSRAARGYETWATAQAEMARGLARRLPENLRPLRMIDLGCGTGFLSALLLDRYPQATLVGLDLAEGMIEACRRRWSGVERASFIAADAEDAGNLTAGADLIACSCSAQWFSAPAETLRKWAGSLRAGGVLACAFLLDESFPELKAASQQALGEMLPGLQLWRAEETSTLAASSALRVCLCEEESITVFYDLSREALRSFKHLGAVLTGRPGYMPLSAAQTRRLLACYDQFADAQGRVPVTHRAHYLIAEKME